jgi:hypothetical protein
MNSPRYAARNSQAKLDSGHALGRIGRASSCHHQAGSFVDVRHFSSKSDRSCLRCRPDSPRLYRQSTDGGDSQDHPDTNRRGRGRSNDLGGRGSCRRHPLLARSSAFEIVHYLRWNLIWRRRRVPSIHAAQMNKCAKGDRAVPKNPTERRYRCIRELVATVASRGAVAKKDSDRG